MIELITLTIFLASLSGIALIISRKVPRLMSLPERLIHESFVTKPSKFHVAAVSLSALIEWRRYEFLLVRFLEKTLRRIRVWILKSDAFVSKILALLQERGRKDTLQREKYWQTLRDLQKNNSESLPPSSMEMPPTGSRIDGIRKLFTRNQKNDLLR